MNRKTSTLMSLGISIALIAVGIWFLCSNQNNIGYGTCGWDTTFHMMLGGGGLGMVVILFWLSVLSAIVLVISGLISNYRSSDSAHKKTSSEAVKSPGQHHARGEIDESRFKTLKRDSG